MPAIQIFIKGTYSKREMFSLDGGVRDWSWEQTPSVRFLMWYRDSVSMEQLNKRKKQDWSIAVNKMRRLHSHKRTIYLPSNNGTAAQCYQLCFMFAGTLWPDIHWRLESTNVCAVLLQTWGKHFLKADTVRKKEIQGRMARKLKQLLLLSREFLFCHSAKKRCQKTDPFMK